MAQRQRHDPSKNLVGFVVGDVSYAVSIHRVREISNPLVVVSLPKAPPSIVGVADYRGEVVPVIDLRLRFGLEEARITRRTKWIVIDVDGRFVALIVDAVTEVFGTGGRSLRPAPSLGGGDDVRGISGVTNHGDTLTFVLDTRKFADLTEPLVASGALSSAPPSVGSLPPSSASPSSLPLIVRKPTSP